MFTLSAPKLQAITEELREILDGEFISPIEDGSISVLPGDTQQVSLILQYASRRRLTVDPRGGGTKLRWANGSVPHIRLGLSRLNRLLDHPWQDLTCTVQAGCTWTSLQQYLARHEQFIALDPLFADRATVGGILATNDSGSLRQRYGGLRDLVIGMTLVLSDGTIARTGGKVVKNVAGYDLSKLLTGSMGTLAVITEANFRLHALPQHTRVFTIGAPDATCLSRLIHILRESHLLMQALQIRRNKSEAHLDISLTSHPAAQQDELLSQMAQAEGLVLQEINEASCFIRDRPHAEGSTFVRISTLPVDVCAFVDQLQHVAQKIDIDSVSQAIGLHDVMFRGSGDEITKVIHNLSSGPSISVVMLEPGPDVDTQAFRVPAPVMSVMRAVKRSFDPDDILGPGKFFVTQ